MARRVAAKFARYLITGGAAAIVDAGGFALLTGMHAPALPAAALSFLIAMLANYGLSSRFVFGSAPSRRSFALFTIAALVGFAVNVAITVAAIAWLRLWPPAAKVLGIGVALAINFSLNLFVAFNVRGKGPSSDLHSGG